LEDPVVLRVLSSTIGAAASNQFVSVSCDSFYLTCLKDVN